MIPEAYEEIKANEDLKLKVMEDKHKQDMEVMREENESTIYSDNVSYTAESKISPN